MRTQANTLPVSTCTHTTDTREHLDTCCADGIDCDQCGQPIAGLTGRDYQLGEPAFCTGCRDAINNGEDA